MKGFGLLLVGLFWYFDAASQVVIDDFESGSLSNWNILQGNAEAVSAPAFAGSFAARLFKPDLPPDAQSLAIHQTFSEDWGEYEVQCFANGSISDIQFLFQYQDGNNYYAVSCNPIATDNATLHLYKLVNGNFQTLAQLPPTFGLNAWFQLKVERFCDGTISVYIDNQLQASVVDTDLDQPGTIAMAAWGESSFFDDITFTSIRDTSITLLTEDICSGTFFEVGSNRYNRSGTYFDTLQDVGGCDSIVQLDLTVHPHFLVSETDTICADTFYLFGNDTLRRTGMYSNSLKSQIGCDSLVELNLFVFGGDTIVENRTICTDDFTIFDGDTLREEGSFFQTLTVDAGCTSTIQLILVVEQPNLDLGLDATVCLDENIRVTRSVNGFDSIQWSDGSSGPDLVISEAGIYWATGFIGTCMDSDTILVTEECLIEEGLYIPNAFSPNGDGVNDLFTVQSSVPTAFNMHIFNRWGSLLFQTDNSLPWDGSVNGDRVPDGVYIYIIESNGQMFSGDVTVVP